MARGQRKSIDEKIAAKEEIIETLQGKLNAEKRELEELFEEKKKRELESLNEMILDAGVCPEEVAAILQKYLEERSLAS
ncbi:MAG: hypothetical protein MJ114_03825 [Acetatifactor sp.]|nr:hypothetical protein [Acetatifactor sp.]